MNNADDFETPEELTLPLRALPESDDEPTQALTAPRSRRKRLVGGIVAGALALTLAVGGFSVAAAHKAVTVSADGALVETGTFTGTVEALLAEQGIEVGEYDEVTPALDSQLADGLEIEIVRAQPVDVLLDGTTDVLWTTEEHVGAALTRAAGGRSVAMAVSRSAERAEIDLPISGDVRIVSMDGAVEATAAAPIALQALLDEHGLTLGEADEITVAAEQDGTTVITIVRWATTRVSESETVEHGATTVKSDKYYEDTKKVTTEGVDGRIDRAFEVTTRDGVEVEKKLVGEVVAVEKVDQVTTVGTKKRPAASSSSSSSSATSGAVGGGVWAKLAQCESGGRASVVSSNGLYHGLYQFTVSTWRSVGGSGLPSQASPAEQTKRAQMLQAKAGWGQWPACSRKLGLR